MFAVSRLSAPSDTRTAYQAREVLDLGAEEIDMVMNIPALKNGEAELFMRDVEGVVRAAEGKTVKVITEKRLACEWIAETGPQFVKTSMAYAEGGALAHACSAGRRPA
jgi:deoxyribose-phosphate aldolase